MGAEKAIAWDMVYALAAAIIMILGLWLSIRGPKQWIQLVAVFVALAAFVFLLVMPVAN
jgi:hypothetical protein